MKNFLGNPNGIANILLILELKFVKILYSNLISNLHVIVEIFMHKVQSSFLLPYLKKSVADIWIE